MLVSSSVGSCFGLAMRSWSHFLAVIVLKLYPIRQVFIWTRPLISIVPKLQKVVITVDSIKVLFTYRCYLSLLSDFICSSVGDVLYGIISFPDCSHPWPNFFGFLSPWTIIRIYILFKFKQLK